MLQRTIIRIIKKFHSIINKDHLSHPMNFNLKTYIAKRIHRSRIQFMQIKMINLEYQNTHSYIIQMMIKQRNNNNPLIKCHVMNKQIFHTYLMLNQVRGKSNFWCFDNLMKSGDVQSCVRYFSEVCQFISVYFYCVASQNKF